MVPRSPVRKTRMPCTVVMTSLVAAGLLWYPTMTLGPDAATSPSTPAPSTSPLSPRVIRVTPGCARMPPRRATVSP
jgi:hypothetical protein